MPISEARRKANEKYLDKLDEIKIRLPKGEKERIKRFAQSHGQSVNAFITELIHREMIGFNADEEN